MADRINAAAAASATELDFRIFELVPPAVCEDIILAASPRKAEMAKEGGNIFMDDSSFADLLTGKSRVEAERTARAQCAIASDPVDFATGMREYHLSDGGCSRICANEEGEVWLTSNSRDQVKEAWKTAEAKAAAKAVGQRIASAVWQVLSPG